MSDGWKTGELRFLNGLSARELVGRYVGALIFFIFIASPIAWIPSFLIAVIFELNLRKFFSSGFYSSQVIFWSSCFFFSTVVVLTLLITTANSDYDELFCPNCNQPRDYLKDYKMCEEATDKNGCTLTEGKKMKYFTMLYTCRYCGDHKEETTSSLYYPAEDYGY